MNEISKLETLPVFGNFVKMGKNTSISLGSHFENFITRMTGSGRYNSTSEVVRAGLRLLEEQENKKNVLRKALIEGEKSGFVENFDPEILLQNLHKKHGV